MLKIFNKQFCSKLRTSVNISSISKLKNINQLIHFISLNHESLTSSDFEPIFTQFKNLKLPEEEVIVKLHELLDYAFKSESYFSDFKFVNALFALITEQYIYLDDQYSRHIASMLVKYPKIFSDREFFCSLMKMSSINLNLELDPQFSLLLEEFFLENYLSIENEEFFSLLKHIARIHRKSNNVWEKAIERSQQIMKDDNTNLHRLLALFLKLHNESHIPYFTHKFINNLMKTVLENFTTLEINIRHKLLFRLLKLSSKYNQDRKFVTEIDMVLVNSLMSKYLALIKSLIFTAENEYFNHTLFGLIKYKYFEIPFEEVKKVFEQRSEKNSFTENIILLRYLSHESKFPNDPKILNFVENDEFWESGIYDLNQMKIIDLIGIFKLLVQIKLKYLRIWMILQNLLKVKLNENDNESINAIISICHKAFRNPETEECIIKAFYYFILDKKEKLVIKNSHRHYEDYQSQGFIHYARKL